MLDRLYFEKNTPVIKTIIIISNIVERICKFISGFSVGVFICVVVLQVVCRNFLKMPLIWANDISVVAFVWSVFFGSAVAVRYRRHYVLELIPERFEKLNILMDILGDICGFVFFAFLIIYGSEFTIMGFRRLSTSINLPQAYFFMCIPFSACFMIWFNAGIFFKDCNRMIESI